MSAPRPLYVPTDVDVAWDAWQANCGPCAVAACLGREVNAVRELFEAEYWPGYTNLTLIKRVIRRAGLWARPSSEETVCHGLGFVQFEGPWERGGARAAYSKTHWVAVARRRLTADSEPFLFIYDAASGGPNGGWLTRDLYTKYVIPLYFERIPKATGWRFRQVLEVS